MSNHSHSCTCEHKEIKYCAHCRTVYCTSCNQEWTAKVPTYWYNGYTYTGNSNLNLQGQVLCNDNQLQDGHTITCSHLQPKQMPFKSKAQQKWMFANKPEMAKEWASHTDFKSLPTRKSKKALDGLKRSK